MAKQPRKSKDCPGCRKTLTMRFFYKVAPISPTRSPRFSHKCRACTNDERRKKNRAIAGIPRDLSLKSYLNHIRLKALGRKGRIDVNTDDLLDLWKQQRGRCALTGWKMTVRRGDGIVRTNASIDRIDSGKGYTLENVQLVCVAANKAKFDLRFEEFLEICRSVLARAVRKNRNRGVRCRKKSKKTGSP